MTKKIIKYLLVYGKKIFNNIIYAKSYTIYTKLDKDMSVHFVI